MPGTKQNHGPHRIVQDERGQDQPEDKDAAKKGQPSHRNPKKQDNEPPGNDAANS
jgi:hypothetical protein